MVVDEDSDGGAREFVEEFWKSVDEKTRVDESRILKKDENFQIDQFRCFYESPEIYERETNRII